MPPELATFLSFPVLLFLVFAAGAIATAVGMVLYPNPVRAALFLVLNLFCVAVLYLLMNAYFLAAVQVIVYAGAIMVLFLFVIMLLNLGSVDRSVDRLRWQQGAAVAAGVVLAAVIGGVVYASVPASPVNVPLPAGADIAASMSAIDPDAMGTVQGVGKVLYDPDLPWLFPFEMTSILLLIATIGSVVLAKRRGPGGTIEGGPNL